MTVDRYKLSDQKWSVIQSILPSESLEKRGRPMKDSRTMIEAMLWVFQTDSSWKELPEEYGSWSSVYTRFRRWSQQGLWQKILIILDWNEDKGSILCKRGNFSGTD